MARPRTLSVYANPYLAIDADDALCGALPTDDVEHTSGQRAWVGAKIRPDHTFDFDAAAQTLPATRYYLAQLALGGLIAADEDTADLAGVTFADPQTLLAAARDRAFAGWLAERPQRLNKPRPEWALDAALPAWAQQRLDAASAAKAVK